MPIRVADPVVGVHRDRLDAAAAQGVPAHVTVLYPFVEPESVDDELVGRLTSAVRSVGAFDCSFARTRWFGHDVLWLEPEPAEPFRRLTAAVWSGFPQCPPYGGAYPDVVPHLTVGERRLADLAALRKAERAVQPGLPLSARIDRVLLIAGAASPMSWRVLHELPLH